jgi:hypothetical protein
MDGLPVERVEFRLSSRKERDIVIAHWITENRERLNISEAIKEAFWQWLQVHEGVVRYQLKLDEPEEIDSQDQLAQNLLGSIEGY